ncbi:hypothetical protein BDZ89DRAFT_947885 [Hymenopellis radicata]|nr:hypothetical protein BDZ89DRAFT_947885 [Hymenopellis radicata]
MVFSYRELFFGGRTFCCCLPVRSGVIIMTFLGMLLSGILSIVCWYEVASTPDMSAGKRAVFVVAGLLETFLFIASVLGFVGAVVRKQVFVQIYTYFIYVHFLFNVAIAGYLLWEVSHLTSEAADKACQDTISNAQAQDQCIGFLKIARGVYYAIASLVLLVELYGAIITTRYCNQLKSEKRMAKAGLFAGPEGYKIGPQCEIHAFIWPSQSQLLRVHANKFYARGTVAIFSAASFLPDSIILRTVPVILRSFGAHFLRCLSEKLQSL